jgi:hypothetical protein
MARLSIRLLGPFQATLDGEPVSGFELDKVPALLAYLAVEQGAPQRREKVVVLLWPDQSLLSAAAAQRRTWNLLCIRSPPLRRNKNTESWSVAHATVAFGALSEHLRFPPLQ